MVMFSVMCFLSLYTFLENLSFPSAFIVPAHSQGGPGGPVGFPVGPSGAMMWYQIVDILLVLKYHCKLTSCVW